jgi:alpha-galactosidase/6-phospho-beta-glucosidase family protein
MVVALSSPRPTFHVTNLLSPRGIVEECPAWISSTSLQACETPRVSAAVEHWLEVFRSHELALLKAATCPSIDTFSEAVRQDPIVSAEKASALAKALWDIHRARQMAAGR